VAPASTGDADFSMELVRSSSDFPPVTVESETHGPEPSLQEFFSTFVNETDPQNSKNSANRFGQTRGECSSQRRNAAPSPEKHGHDLGVRWVGTTVADQRSRPLSTPPSSYPAEPGVEFKVNVINRGRARPTRPPTPGNRCFQPSSVSPPGPCPKGFSPLKTIYGGLDADLAEPSCHETRQTPDRRHAEPRRRRFAEHTPRPR